MHLNNLATVTYHGPMGDVEQESPLGESLWNEQPAYREDSLQRTGHRTYRPIDGTLALLGISARDVQGVGCYQSNHMRAPGAWQDEAYPPRHRDPVRMQAQIAQASVITLARNLRPTDYFLGYRQAANVPASSNAPLGYG